MKVFKLFLALGVFVFATHLTVMAFAQAPAASPAASAAPAISAPAPASTNPIWDFFMKHGGPEATVLLLVTSFNAVVSMLRQQMAAWDGVDLTKPIDPAAYSKLSFVNKLCLYSGKLLDLLTGNAQHS